jgi:dsRNA-specific ribonuclease
MKRDVMVGLYFLIYIAIPVILLHVLTKKYPEIGEGGLILYTMAYLLSMFLASVASIYTKYLTPPTLISAGATIAYLVMKKEVIISF